MTRRPFKLAPTDVPSYVRHSAQRDHDETDPRFMTDAGRAAYEAEVNAIRAAHPLALRSQPVHPHLVPCEPGGESPLDRAMRDA